MFLTDRRMCCNRTIHGTYILRCCSANKRVLTLRHCRRGDLARSLARGLGVRLGVSLSLGRRLRLLGRSRGRGGGRGGGLTALTGLAPGRGRSVRLFRLVGEWRQPSLPQPPSLLEVGGQRQPRLARLVRVIGSGSGLSDQGQGQKQD